MLDDVNQGRFSCVSRCRSVRPWSHTSRSLTTGVWGSNWSTKYVVSQTKLTTTSCGIKGLCWLRRINSSINSISLSTINWIHSILTIWLLASIPHRITSSKTNIMVLRIKSRDSKLYQIIYKICWSWYSTNSAEMQKESDMCIKMYRWDCCSWLILIYRWNLVVFCLA